MNDVQLKFLESPENLKSLIKSATGRECSTTLARQIMVCIQQGRLFYEAATSSPIEIKPLQLFYGMVGFARALVLFRNQRGLETLQQRHGIEDKSQQNTRLEDLIVKIGTKGTFQEFNDVARSLSRLCYFVRSATPVAKYFCASESSKLCGKQLSIKDILSRIPGLESLYEATFREEANTKAFRVFVDESPNYCEIRIFNKKAFSDLSSLKTLITTLRAKYPSLQKWQLVTAERVWGESQISFANVVKTEIDEFSESYLEQFEGGFRTRMQLRNSSVKTNDFTSLFSPIGGGYSHADPSMIAPFEDIYISEFSSIYLGMFLLSSLVRYRPHTWVHAISRSVNDQTSADDRALALFESFMNLSLTKVPVMVVRVMNFFEDQFTTITRP